MYVFAGCLRAATWMTQYPRPWLEPVHRTTFGVDILFNQDIDIPGKASQGEIYTVIYLSQVVELNGYIGVKLTKGSDVFVDHIFRVLKTFKHT